MIITDKAQEAAAHGEVLQQEPPPYSDNNALSRTPIPRALNFVSVIRNDKSIKTNFAINPRMAIPPSLLPPLSEGETEADRKNLRLESRDCDISTEVWLLSDESRSEDASGSKTPQQPADRTTLLLLAMDGRINAKIHTVGQNPRLPFHLTATSHDGSVSIQLPRSFHGPMAISIRHGPLQLSKGLQAQTTTFSDSNRVIRSFVGDFSEWLESESAGEKWKGDEIYASSNDGSVKLQYDDEVSEKSGGFGGFIGRVFGI